MGEAIRGNWTRGPWPISGLIAEQGDAVQPVTGYQCVVGSLYSRPPFPRVLWVGGGAGGQKLSGSHLPPVFWKNLNSLQRQSWLSQFGKSPQGEHMVKRKLSDENGPKPYPSRQLGFQGGPRCLCPGMARSTVGWASVS